MFRTILGVPSPARSLPRSVPDGASQAPAAEKSVALERVRPLQKLGNANDITAWAVLAGLAAAVLAIALAAAAVITAIFAE
jgi:hypothetical protein